MEAQDDDGRTPLDGTFEGDPNVVTLLLDLGANIKAKNNDGFTPLHRAAYEGSRSDVEALLNQGADIHATANIAVDGHRWEGITPLHVATLNPDMAVAELLLDRGADIHAVAMANGAWTMVHFALQSQRSDELQAMINFLISRGAQT